MVDPVIAADGHTYERDAVEKWLQRSSASPVTGLKVANQELLPNLAIGCAINEELL